MPNSQPDPRPSAENLNALDSAANPPEPASKIAFLNDSFRSENAEEMKTDQLLLWKTAFFEAWFIRLLTELWSSTGKEGKFSRTNG
jgi:hypothetical protein